MLLKSNNLNMVTSSSLIYDSQISQLMCIYLLFKLGGYRPFESGFVKPGQLFI